MNIIDATVHEFGQTVPLPRDDVFAWHTRPGAFSRLQAPWLPGRIIREAESLRDGTAVLAFPAGRRWLAQHLPEEFIEGGQFADRLASRPFVVPVRWHHRHTFKSVEGGTSVLDSVTTVLPRRLIDPMFAYRHRQLADDLRAHQLAAGRSLTVAITGASGLIGSALRAFLTTGGHTVVRLVRCPAQAPDEREWDPHAPSPEALAGVDAVVHLAGHGIAGRFTAEHWRQMRASRVGPTGRLAHAAATAGVPVFVSASAIGYYGADRGDEQLGEQSAAGRDFLAQVVRDWEADALGAATADLRVVTVRTGLVQSPRGGALALQRRLFAADLGGRLGSGDQWQSWIGIDDLLDIYLRAILDERLEGPVNAVAPRPVPQHQHAAALGHALHRPALIPTPTLGPRLLLGREGTREVALASQRVVPTRLTELGHRFRFTDVEDLLRHLLGSTIPGQET